MAVGPDGALYVCNNGGLAYELVNGMPNPTGPARDYRCGRIEHVDIATGKSETLFDRCDDISLSSPNDIVFDDCGGFYFTDLGKSIGGIRQPGGLFYARSDSAKIQALIYPMASLPNGCGLSPNGHTLYVSETRTARLLAFPVLAPGLLDTSGEKEAYGGEILCQLPAPAKFDSHAIDGEGNICVGTLETGEISVIAPDGQLIRSVGLPDSWVTNICFGGEGLRTAYVTLSKTGRLASLQWPMVWDVRA